MADYKKSMRKLTLYLALILFVVVAFIIGSWLLLPPKQQGQDFSAVIFHSCYDGDTCTFTIPGVHPLLGRKIGVRLAGIDTPEIRAKCPEESRGALRAKAYLNQTLRKARQIRLRNPRRGKYFRIVAEIEADGVALNKKLIAEGLARPYEGGKKQGWCG